MKLVELHDGKNIVFPPDMEDGAIDKMVKAHLGIDDDAPKMALLVAGFESLSVFAQQLLASQAALVHEIGTLRNALEPLAKAMESNGEISKNAALLLHSGLQQVSSALTAPKRISTDSEGKPTGLEVR